MLAIALSILAVAVIDGDTVTIGTETVRIANIDAPEMGHARQGDASDPDDAGGNRDLADGALVGGAGPSAAIAGRQARHRGCAGTGGYRMTTDRAREAADRELYRIKCQAAKLDAERLIEQKFREAREHVAWARTVDDIADERMPRDLAARAPSPKLVDRALPPSPVRWYYVLAGGALLPLSGCSDNGQERTSAP